MTESDKEKLDKVRKQLTLGMVILALSPLSLLWFYRGGKEDPRPLEKPISADSSLLAVYDPGDIKKADSMVRYGRELMLHTAEYFGPAGEIGHFTNGLNCGDCHMDAGLKPLSLNLTAVASTYPKYMPRLGREESVYERVKDCFERSLNGTSPDSVSKEMQAILAYLAWIGAKVPKGVTPKTSGVKEPKYMARAADPLRGERIFALKCVECHGSNGQGAHNHHDGDHPHPALWGDRSYNDGAGLFRLGRLAGFLKASMPFGATADKPQLSDEEAWDLAAYINSKPHPKANKSLDWPNIAEKPKDYPFGPFKDSFSEEEHKLGPYLAMIKNRGK